MRVVIADDHPLVRNALRDILSEIHGVEIAAEAENGVEAIALVKTQKPTLLTLDSGMPLASGMEVYGEVRRWSPDSRIAVVTGFTAGGQLADWVAAGVDGLFLKTCPPEEIRDGFALLLNGGTYYSKAVMATLEGAPDRPKLSVRERQVLHMIAEGRTNAEIAEQLSIARKQSTIIARALWPNSMSIPLPS